MVVKGLTGAYERREGGKALMGSSGKRRGKL